MKPGTKRFGGLLLSALTLFGGCATVDGRTAMETLGQGLDDAYRAAHGVSITDPQVDPQTGQVARQGWRVKAALPAEPARRSWGPAARCDRAPRDRPGCRVQGCEGPRCGARRRRAIAAGAIMAPS